VAYYQSKLHQRYRNMLHRNGPVDYEIWGVMHQCVYGTKIWHLWPAKMLDANLGWLWTEHYRGCDWPVARQSEIMYVCWWRTLWTHAAKLLFICIMWFIRTFYETVNVIWCIWQLCIFGVSTLTRMWANAQPDGRPAEHRWRPLFNAAKFGWRPLLDAVQ